MPTGGYGRKADMLDDQLAIDVTLMKGLCALDVAIRDGLELLAALD
jgi:hypothetical protein